MLQSQGQGQSHAPFKRHELKRICTAYFRWRLRICVVQHYFSSFCTRRVTSRHVTTDRVQKFVALTVNKSMSKNRWRLESWINRKLYRAYGLPLKCIVAFCTYWTRVNETLAYPSTINFIIWFDLNFIFEFHNTWTDKIFKLRTDANLIIAHSSNWRVGET